jgi:hypothetical protein
MIQSRIGQIGSGPRARLDVFRLLALVRRWLALGMLDLEPFESVNGCLTLVLCQPDLEQEQHDDESGEAEIQSHHSR